jgi:hypothetical protein
MGPPGHFSIGFALKPAAPTVPIWVFLMASWILDFLSFGFDAIGLEEFGVTQVGFENGIRVITTAIIPWSHGLVMSIFWSIIFGIGIYFFYRDRRTSIILGLVVFSHWVLDFIVHPPDLPLFFAGSPNLGLGLWTSGPGLVASIILEFALLIAGVAIYMMWRKREKTGSKGQNLELMGKDV